MQNPVPREDTQLIVRRVDVMSFNFIFTTVLRSVIIPIIQTWHLRPGKINLLRVTEQ